jgi:hypothetical protein
MAEYDVFISYRREDSSDRANLIRSYLSDNFQSERIFLDTHEIHEGPFPEYIDSALKSSTYFVVLISRCSFSNRKNGDDIDYYYEEIKRALSYNLTIIPVIYDNIDLNSFDIPKDCIKIKSQNAILSHSDDPLSLKRKLLDFTKVRNRKLKDWIAFPLAIISIYFVVSLLSAIGMYIYDNYFRSYDSAVEVAAEHVFENEGIFYYPISDNMLISYAPDSGKISNLINESPSGNSICVSEDNVYKIGFWSTVTGLVYQLIKSKYKPHNGKQYLAYIGAVVAVVAGIGLGCTLEQMAFPTYRNRIICKYIEEPSFWKDLVKIKYSRINSQFYY